MLKKKKRNLEKSKIILTAEANLHDEELREWVDKLNTKIDTINERTKNHTLEIKELKRMMKSK